MTVFSDKDIVDAYNIGKIVIDPFDSKSVGTSSYDVRLGKNYYKETRPREEDHVCWEGRSIALYNIYDYENILSVWELCEALSAEKFFSIIGKKLQNISEEDSIILLGPHETVLGHTVEFIGARYQATTMMKARSSMGRNFIEMCRCAGWGDIGYTSIWTLEITNNSRFRHIPLVVGRRVAQIVFFNTGLNQGNYPDDGTYQATSNQADLKIAWHPTMMLPRSDKDRDIKK
jgi:dCTP deaminase